MENTSLSPNYVLKFSFWDVPQMRPLLHFQQLYQFFLKTRAIPDLTYI